MLSSYLKTLVNPAVLSKDSESKTLQCGSLDGVKLVPDATARVADFGSDRMMRKFRDLPKSKATK